MTRFAIAFLAAAFLAGCGGPPLTPVTACEESVEAQCEKQWSCPNPGLKIGSDLASCKTQFKALCSLSTCDSPKTFDAMAASGCSAAVKAQTCDQFSAGMPDACKNACK